VRVGYHVIHVTQLNKDRNIEVLIGGNVFRSLRFPLRGSEHGYLRKDQKEQDRESNSSAIICRIFVKHFSIN
jgi:hypothetical protein